MILPQASLEVTAGKALSATSQNPGESESPS